MSENELNEALKALGNRRYPYSSLTSEHAGIVLEHIAELEAAMLEILNDNILLDVKDEYITELEEREQKYIKALAILMPECEMNNMTQPAIAALGDLVDDIPAEKRALRWECKLG